jgi:hypothetical protein
LETCTWELEQRPGGPLLCGEPALWPGPRCYLHHKAAELEDGQRSPEPEPGWSSAGSLGAGSWPPLVLELSPPLGDYTRGWSRAGGKGRPSNPSTPEP